MISEEVALGEVELSRVCVVCCKLASTGCWHLLLIHVHTGGSGSVCVCVCVCVSQCRWGSQCVSHVSAYNFRLEYSTAKRLASHYSATR